MMTPADLEKLMAGLPPEMRARLTQQQGRLQSGLLSFMGHLAKGEVKYLERRFKTPAALVAFLNTNRERVLTWQAVPDFQSYEYVLIYEETNG